MQLRSIGLFGGTFNPVHYGHLRAAEEVLTAFSLEKVVFIPSCNPPLKKQGLAPSDDRLEMVRLAAESNVRFEVSDIESKRQGLSYTIWTLKELLQDYGDHAVLYFILGMDSFLDLPNWYQALDVISTVNFIILTRPPLNENEILKSPYVDADALSFYASKNVTKVKLKHKKDAFLLKVTAIDISSTQIRQLISRGESVKYLLPENVQSYIIHKGLYREQSTE
ncbi:nicotinate-nucleotide adenylyltransferase [Candidatus Magnetomonas plexicatena]|uniref:nicotinate-nucleotide adenylyltransferase n=1 Tax=Candidatus Magnetomonas plexicatena TaxID=2552947 RepID=UPI0011040962|nr:nicotinate (nicotinamide) nucleotide adenylyltransferase [Nitrospirales bacterium LBB_01]